MAQRAAAGGGAGGWGVSDEIKTINQADEIQLPPGMFACPICGAAVVIEDIDGWEQNDDGTWQVVEAGLHVNCETEPEFDAPNDEWEDWNSGHWGMPYVDWLPIRMKVWNWVVAHYRIDMDDADGETRG